MKKSFIVFVLGFFTVLAFGQVKGVKHVVLIGLDGWGSYSVNKAEMPHIKNMMAEGAYTLKKRSVLPSSSAVNWASMFMGAGPELHGYTEWGSQTPELPSRILDEDGIFPTVFGLLRRTVPEAEIGCIYEWDGIAYVVDTLALSYRKHVTETVFIVTSDHGGINKGHGGKTMREMETPFIICGKGVKKGHLIEGSMMQFDIASTIASIFGLQQPQVWIGRPVTEVFE